MGTTENFVTHYHNLRTYILSRELSAELFECTKAFPKEERYSLTDQIRRSSRSIGAQIAEAWGKRRYERHFVSKLTDADSERLETQHWIDIAVDCKYLTEEKSRVLIEKSLTIGKMIHTMIIKSNTFCTPQSP